MPPPIARLVRRQILLGINNEHWYWQLPGYGARHLAAVERDAQIVVHWVARSCRPNEAASTGGGGGSTIDPSAYPSDGS
jgi:hypothetical protein